MHACVSACLQVRKVIKSCWWAREATECSAALTWWQMKIKKLLLKWEEYVFNQAFVNTCKMQSVQWQESRVDRVGGHTGPGQVCENKMGDSYFWPNNSEICQETYVVESPDEADRERKKKRLLWKMAMIDSSLKSCSVKPLVEAACEQRRTVSLKKQKHLL